MAKAAAAASAAAMPTHIAISKATAAEAAAATAAAEASGNNSKSNSSGGGDNATTSDYDGDHFVFKADKVVFLNDVYFCAQHIHRLLAHEEANLACGLDYYQVATAKHIPYVLRKGMWEFQVCML